MLGDNIFYGQGLGIPAAPLRRPRRRGGVRLLGRRPDGVRRGRVRRRRAGRSRWRRSRSSRGATTPCPGLYFYDNEVVEIARGLKPRPAGSTRSPTSTGAYLERGPAAGRGAPRGTAWLDTGTFDSLNDASNFIRTLEHRQGLKIGCPEEVAWRQGFLTDDELPQRATALAKSGYGAYLLQLLEMP